MDTNKILSASLIDIIFDGRNKDYGAYELRKTYSKRIKKALLATFLFAFLVVGGVVLASTVKNTRPDYRITDEMTIQAIDDTRKPEKLPEPVKPKADQPQVQTEKYTIPEIKPDEDVQTPPPSTTDLTDARIDIDTRAGIPDDGSPDPGPQDMDGNKGIIDDKIVKEKGPAENVDIDAKFDGNWKRFLETNLNASTPVDNNAPEGRYSVVVRFVVDVDGSISDITPLTKHGYGLEEEAVRVIRKSKKWAPAFLNGVNVKAYKKQVIIFEVLGE
ncbi:MAG: energy transducer TonB [Chitinophagaceae bacterium]